ncbi:MAG: hypothetical protein Q8934_11190 [Bacillota bacterium]|nr:hypothetical protein [Bacillota bacterium]
MIIPNIYKGEHTPSLDEVITKIIDSVAEEELALAQLISSEANKINAFVGEYSDFPTSPTNSDILKFNQSVQKIIDSVMMKEWLLYKKIEMVLTLVEKVDFKNKHILFPEDISEFGEE